MNTISKVAEQVGLTTYTLRYYEKEGLIPEITKNEQGIRMYTEDNIFWIELVKCLKDTGMPIAEIKKIIQLSLEGDATMLERKAILMQHKKVIEEQMMALQKSMEKIDKKIAWYEGNNKSC